MTLKYKPRKKIFENCTLNNSFDGVRGVSYGDWTYALKWKEGLYFVVDKPYSVTTGNHMYEFYKLIGYDNTFIKIPNEHFRYGKLDLDDSCLPQAIQEAIDAINVKLANKRIRPKTRAALDEHKLQVLDSQKLYNEYLSEIKSKQINEVA